MSVAVAHQGSAIGAVALREGVREAALRRTDLAVLHVVEDLDLDVTEEDERFLAEEVEAAVISAGGRVPYDLHLVAADNVAETVLDLAGQVGATLLVIGARRRSLVGKFLLGSVTQSIILDADIPVLVVKDDS